MIMGRFATYFRAWHQALFQDFNNTAPAAYSTALPADNGSLSANRYLVFRRWLKGKRGRAHRAPSPDAAFQHRQRGRARAASRALAGFSARKQDWSNRCASRNYARNDRRPKSGARNTAPGFKNEAPRSACSWGPRLKIKRIARQFYRQSASHRRRQT